MSRNNFKIGILSDAGNTKVINQDNVLVEIGENKAGEFGLFAVADGMGGLSNGETASLLCVDMLKAWWNSELKDFFKLGEIDFINSVGNSLEELFASINKSVRAYSESTGKKTGTTLTLLFIHKDSFLIKHIGDSRVYRVNRDITQLTFDHTWVAAQVMRGNMDKEEARRHPDRNVLTQCLGVRSDIDVFELTGTISSKDTFLICSDGFYNSLDEEEILGLIGYGEKSEEAFQALLGKLMEQGRSRGEKDNISAIIVYRSIEKFISLLGQKIKRAIGIG